MNTPHSEPESQGCIRDEEGSRQDLTQPDAAISVSAPIDLARTSELLSSGINRLYNQRFVWDARRELEVRRRAGLLKTDVKLPWNADLKKVDDLYVAPLGGFSDRHDYYRRASSGPHLSKIRIPTVLLTSADDPFVDVESYRRAKFSPSVDALGALYFAYVVLSRIRVPTPLILRAYLPFFLVENRLLRRGISSFSLHYFSLLLSLFKFSVLLFII